jgi:hypothetical protein
MSYYKKYLNHVVVDSGEFVVPRNNIDWVYDVKIKDAVTKEVIAVVGFSSKQKDGAVFWQRNNGPFDETYKNVIYNEIDIKEMAKNYAIVKSVPIS